MTTANAPLTGRRRALLQCLWLLPVASLAQSNSYDQDAERFALEFMRHYSLALGKGQGDSDALVALYKAAVDQSRISFAEFQGVRRALGEILKYAPTRGRSSDRQERRGTLFVTTLRCLTETGSWNIAIGLARPAQTEWKVVQIQLEPD